LNVFKISEGNIYTYRFKENSIIGMEII